MKISTGGTPIWVVLGPDPSAEEESGQTILSMTDDEDEAETWLTRTVLQIAEHHSSKIGKGGSVGIYIQRASAKRNTKMTASIVFRGSKTHKHEWNFEVDCWNLTPGAPITRPDRTLDSALEIFKDFGKAEE